MAIRPESQPPALSFRERLLVPIALIAGFAFIVCAALLFLGKGPGPRGLEVFYGLLLLVGAGLSFWGAHGIVSSRRHTPPPH